MLQGTFYTLLSLQQPAATSLLATIELNAGHDIFKGHFPGQPVVPGVCMLQIVKECLEQVLLRKVQLRQAGNIKFLTVLTPDAHQTVEVRVNFESSGNTILVPEAFISAGTTRFLRMQQASYA